MGILWLLWVIFNIILFSTENLMQVYDITFIQFIAAHALVTLMLKLVIIRNMELIKVHVIVNHL